MTTVKDVIQDVIFEEKKQNLKVFYNIDVFIQEFKDKEEEPEAAAPAAPAAPAPAAPAPEEGGEAETPAEEEETPAESFDDEGNLLTEAIYKRKVEGEIVVPKEEAEHLQTLQDLVDYLSDKKHAENKTSSVARVLGKKAKKVKGESIISPTIQEVILVLAGAGQSALDDIVDKGDKIIVEVKYGKDKYDNIGFKITKNAGTSVFSIMLVKDGEILPGQFNQALLNKQILYYRNSIA